MYPAISLHIDGSWTKAAGGKTIPVLNPASGEPLGAVPHAETADLERAVHAAEKGFRVWRKVSAFERYGFMRKAANNLRQWVDDVARTMTLEQGKPVNEAKLETLNAAAPTGGSFPRGSRASISSPSRNRSDPSRHSRRGIFRSTRRSAKSRARWRPDARSSSRER